MVEFVRTEMQMVREEMSSRMASVDQKLVQQGGLMEELQLKLTLSMDSIGQVQQDQVMVKKALGRAVPPPLIVPARDEAGILAARPEEMKNQATMQQEIPHAQNPQVQFPPPTPVMAEVTEPKRGNLEQGRNWLPKMDFPRFDGTDARIWVDKCHTFFYLVQDPRWIQSCSSDNVYVRQRSTLVSSIQDDSRVA